MQPGSFRVPVWPGRVRGLVINRSTGGLAIVLQQEVGAGTSIKIHSVEARHASEVRRLRGNFLDNVPNRGWITGAQTDIPLTSAFYTGEDNTVQAGIDITTLSFSADDASEAFDERPVPLRPVR